MWLSVGLPIQKIAIPREKKIQWDFFKKSRIKIPLPKKKSRTMLIKSKKWISYPGSQMNKTDEKFTKIPKNPLLI